ncbi:hypothetical protein B0T13DRAFT_461290 [Neurospora crassa]|nr:hypothetical protein B0T13DRAFT_461290 [Neurospora crassa]
MWGRRRLYTSPCIGCVFGGSITDSSTVRWSMFSLLLLFAVHYCKVHIYMQWRKQSACRDGLMEAIHYTRLVKLASSLGWPRKVELTAVLNHIRTGFEFFFATCEDGSGPDQ